MKSKMIATAGSIALLAVAAAPIAQAASVYHNPSVASHDASLDRKDSRHIDTAREKASPDKSRDTRDH
jgi:hypothetical protein